MQNPANGFAARPLGVKPPSLSGAAYAVDHHPLYGLCRFGFAFLEIHVPVWLAKHAFETRVVDVEDGPACAELWRGEAVEGMACCYIQPRLHAPRILGFRGYDHPMLKFVCRLVRRAAFRVDRDRSEFKTLWGVQAGSAH